MYISETNSSEILYISLFYTKSYGSESQFWWIYLVIQIFEVLLILLAGLVNVYTVYMAFHTKTFHSNLNLIYGLFMLHWFEIITSRCLVFPYQEALLPISASLHKPDSLILYTFDDTVIPVLRFKDFIWLLLGAGLRIRYMLLVCFALPCVAVERCFATWFVRDYEQKSREYISGTLIILSEILATCGSYLITQRLIGIFCLAVTATIMQIVSYLVVELLKQRTKYFEEKCQRNSDFYSLSVKYQLTENVQSFKVIHIMVMEVGFMIMTTAITILLADLNLISSDHTVFVFFALEKLIHINPIFISIAIFCIKPNWFRRLIRLIPINLNHKTHAIDYLEDKNKRNRPCSADIHFEQLKKLW